MRGMGVVWICIYFYLFFPVIFADSEQLFSLSVDSIEYTDEGVLLTYLIQTKKKDVDFSSYIVFDEENLEVGYDKFSCSGLCKKSLLIKRTLLGKHTLEVQGKLGKNRVIQKENFVVSAQSNEEYSLEVPETLFVLENSTSAIFKATLKTKEPDLFIINLIPKTALDIVESFEVFCNGMCEFQKEIHNVLILGDYYVNVYSSLGEKQYEFTLSYVGGGGNVELSEDELGDIEINKKIKNNFNKLLSFENEIELGSKIDLLINSKKMDFEEIGIKTQNFKVNKPLDFNSNYSSNNNLNNILQITHSINSITDLNNLHKRYNLPHNDFLIKKPQNIENIENNSNMKLSKLFNLENNQSQVEFIDGKNKIKINGVDVNKIKKIESLKSKDSSFITDIVNVEVDEINLSTITLLKNKNQEVREIITCEDFINDDCSGKWREIENIFFQNNTHVWFNVDHFSAYAAIGFDFNYTVDFNFMGENLIINKSTFYPIDLNLICNQNDCGDINVTLNYGQEESIIFSDDFETNFGDWSVDGGSCTWIRNQDTTPSANTGPGGNANGQGFDHTVGDSTGWYVFVEASANVCQGGDNQAVLTSNAFTPGNVSTNISFWYHLIGNSVGTLHFDVLNGGVWVNDVWSVSGAQQLSVDDDFIEVNLDLTQFRSLTNIRLRYDGVSGWQADLAIDDIKISKVDEEPISTVLGNTPFWINSSNPETMSSILGDSERDLLFYLNASGNVGDRFTIFADATVSDDFSIRAQSRDINITIADGNNPNVSKISPGDNSIFTNNLITFVGNASDDYGLDFVRLHVWDSDLNLVHVAELDLVGVLSSEFQINYSFDFNGVYYWNFEIFDIGGLSSFAGENYEIDLVSPALNMEYLFSDPLKLVQGEVTSVDLNVTCLDGDCLNINVSAYYLDVNPVQFDIENFETSYGDWNVDGGTCDWLRNQDTTPSAQTGPGGNAVGFDHTIGDDTGWYIFVETSAGSCDGGDIEAVLLGTPFDIGGFGGEISFWYHMFDNNQNQMGDLHLDVFDGTQWIDDVFLISGQQQTNQDDPYLQAIIDLSEYAGIINIRFRYDNMITFRADIAIDDIELYKNEVTPTLLSTNLGDLPFWTSDNNPQQISLLNGESQIVSFEIVGTGNLLERYFGFFDANFTQIQGIDRRGDEFEYFIVEDVLPSGNKITPVNETVLSAKSDIFFNASVADNYGLDFASLLIWDTDDDLYYSENISLDGALSADVSFSYEFQQNGNFTWNVLVEDLSGNSYFLDDGVKWLITMDFPDLDIDIFNYTSNIILVQNSSVDFSINVSCLGGDCDLINTGLYYLNHKNIFEGFESGLLNASLWEIIESGPNGRQRFMTNGVCAGLAPFEGSYNLGFDIDPTGTYVDNVLKSLIDFSNYSSLSENSFDLSYFLTDQGDESQQCGNHVGDTCNGDGTFFTCDGNSWNEIDYYDPANSADNNWINKEFNLLNEPNFCQDINSSFAIKFSQYDNFACSNDGIFFDNIEINFIEDILIEETSSQPFWSMGTNLRDSTLLETESIVLDYVLNGTGLRDSSYLVYFKTESVDYSEISGYSFPINITIVAPLDVSVNFTEGTPINNAILNQNWIFVNSSIKTNYLDEVILDWNGVNESIPCFGSEPDYNCFINKTNLDDGVYGFKIYVNNTYGYFNSTLNRNVFVDTSGDEVSNSTKIVLERSVLRIDDNLFNVSFNLYNVLNETTPIYKNISFFTYYSNLGEISNVNYLNSIYYNVFNYSVFMNISGDEFEMLKFDLVPQLSSSTLDANYGIVNSNNSFRISYLINMSSNYSFADLGLGSFVVE
jgi:hypothetical protein